MIPPCRVHVQVCRGNRKSWGAPAGSRRRVNSYTSPAGRQPAIRQPAFTGKHRVGRVLSFFSSRRNWDSLNPSPAGECAPLPRFWGEGHTRWRERGWESPNSAEGTYTLVLFLYMYFVVVKHSTLYSNIILWKTAKRRATCESLLYIYTRVRQTIY